MRAFFFVILLFCSQLSFANDVVTFFSQLEGKWELTKGHVKLIDSKGETSILSISKLSTTTTRTYENQWKFVETFCTKNSADEESCVDSIYFYQLLNDKLLLITPEGTTELTVVEPRPDHLGFALNTEVSSSFTSCSFLSRDVLFQDGFSINADGSSSSQYITIHKVL